MECLSPCLLRCTLILMACVIGVPPTESNEDEIEFLLDNPCRALLYRNMEREWNGEEENGHDPETFRGLTLACLYRFKSASPVILPSVDVGSSSKPRRARGLLFRGQNRLIGPIYPGTKWCGPGDIASGFWDLGELSKEDQCCREHDYCPEQIVTGQCSHGLCNTAPFTRSHCECDENFRHCLQSLKSPAADTIGAIYFNVGRNICFAEADGNELNSERKSIETHFGSERMAFELWTKHKAEKFTPLRSRRMIECSKRTNCQYKYYAQQPYTEATGNNAFHSRSDHFPRLSNQKIEHSQFSDVLLDKQGLLSKQPNGSYIFDEDNQTAEIISKFFRRLLRSTGILRSRQH